MYTSETEEDFRGCSYINFLRDSRSCWKVSIDILRIKALKLDSSPCLNCACLFQSSIASRNHPLLRIFVPGEFIASLPSRNTLLAIMLEPKFEDDETVDEFFVMQRVAQEVLTKLCTR